MNEAWTKAMNSLGTSRIDRTLNLNGKLKWSYNFFKSKLFFAMLVFELILLPQPKLNTKIQLLKAIDASRLIKRHGNIAPFVATLRLSKPSDEDEDGSVIKYRFLRSLV